MTERRDERVYLFEDQAVELVPPEPEKSCDGIDRLLTATLLVVAVSLLVLAASLGVIALSIAYAK